MSADNNLRQQFSYRRINFKIRENGVDARTLLSYDFKVWLTDFIKFRFRASTYVIFSLSSNRLLVVFKNMLD